MRISDWSSDVCSSDLAAAGQLAPQDGREGEADEVVEGAARHVGVDQLLVEAARVLESLDHRLLGDLVEHHALDVNAVQHVAPLHLVDDVPGDCLALAIRVEIGRASWRERVWQYV